MPTHLEQIESLEKTLRELSKPAAVIPNTSVFTEETECTTHGVYHRRTRKMDAIGRIMSFSPCPECTREKIEKLKREHAETSERIRQDDIRRLTADLDIPDRFKAATFESYHPANSEAARCLKVCQAYASKWNERLKQGGGLVMCGKPGTGKNHLAFAIAKHVITEHQSSARFTSALRIARSVKATWSKTAEKTESDVIDQYSSPDLLIIDEIGVQFGSESEKMILFEIINNRYEDMKPTILISNLPLDELAGFIGERVLDRMNEGGGCSLAFTWDSYRSRAA